MFDISNNFIITMTRGDYAETDLYINLGTELDPLIFNINNYPNSKVFFGIMEPNARFEDSIIKKTFTKKDFNDDGLSLRIIFKPEDTEFLLPGIYYYTVKLLRFDDSGNEIVDTVIQKRKFILLD